MQLSEDSDELTVLRLPRPSCSATAPLRAAELGDSDISPIGQSDRPALEQVGACTPLPQSSTSVLRKSPPRSPARPSIEALLGRAELLANVLAVSDPRGRLLQVALLRRDYTLIEAVLKSLDASNTTPQLPQPARRAFPSRTGKARQQYRDSSRQSRATERPKAPRRRAE